MIKKQKNLFVKKKLKNTSFLKFKLRNLKFLNCSLEKVNFWEFLYKTLASKIRQ